MMYRGGAHARYQPRGEYTWVQCHGKLKEVGDAGKGPEELVKVRRGRHGVLVSWAIVGVMFDMRLQL